MPLLRARRVATPKAVLVVAVLGSSVAFADGSSVNIAIPDIAHEFPGSTLSGVSWVLNSYNIVFAAFLVAGGQLADLLGRRRIFSFGLFLFATASALCALAPSLGLLISARVIEAAGAALLVPSSLAIVLEAHHAGERVHAVALGSAVAALAAGLGPPIGGLLITASSWRLIFVVNVAVSLLAFMLARRVLVESRAPGRRRVPDLLGGLVLALAIASLVLAILKGAEWGWANARVLTALAAAIALGGWFALRTTRARTPVIDPALLRIRAFEIANGATLLIAGGFFAYALCNVLFLTEIWKYSILDAGLALTPEPFIAMALAMPTIHLVRRVGDRPVLVAGALIWAAGMAYLAFVLPDTPDFLGGWLPGMVLLGIGSGLNFPTLSGLAVSTVPGPRFALATSLNSVATQLGGALGLAILVALLGETAAPAAFDHGWLFAGGCFLVGAIACAALAVSHEETAAAPVAQAPAGPSAEDLAWARAAALPRLADADGERAEVAPQSAAEFLRDIPMFAGLTTALLEQVAELAMDISLRRGEWLFRQGEEADGLYVVRVGHLEVIQEGTETHAINTLTRGAVLGELALLSDSERSASIRALRDTEVLRIDRVHFEALLRAEPELALALTRVLSGQLQASRAIPVAKRPRPVTIAMCTIDPAVPAMEIADELSRTMCLYGRAAVLHPGAGAGGEDAGAGGLRTGSRAEAAARFGPLVERCEREHDQVLMLCGSAQEPSAWDEFCLARADRVLALVAGPKPDPGDPAGDVWAARLHGADLVGYGMEAASGGLAGWIETLSPGGTFAIAAGAERRTDVARMARRLTGRAVGIVLGGAGARALAHLGVLEVLLDAGVPVDRIGGVSMGAFVGALLAQGHDSAAIDACCYEEWVRRNPLNDYTIPRSSLIKGQKTRAMLDRVFGEARIEELPRSFYSASVDLHRSRLVIDRDGPLARAVGASITLPLIAPPTRREESLLVDGSLLDNLPLAPMSRAGEGPVLAIDIKGREDTSDSAPQEGDPAHPDARSRRRLPPLTDTMARIALLSSANTDEAARRHADMTIAVAVDGVGLLEFHQIDQARKDGRRAASAALEDAPGWLVPGATGQGDISGRRTVVRV
jgi:EmrB/QacA subfamily drug resistance transporter